MQRLEYHPRLALWQHDGYSYFVGGTGHIPHNHPGPNLVPLVLYIDRMEERMERGKDYQRAKPSLLCQSKPMQRKLTKAVFCFAFDFFSPMLEFSATNRKSVAGNKALQNFLASIQLEKFSNQLVLTHRTNLAANQIKFLLAKATCP